ncbi:MAG: DUF2905 domain-containing protein [bacterium]
MPVFHNIGKLLIISGMVILIIGVLFILVGKLNLQWFGRLPGDIYIKKKNFSFYFPLSTSILISIALSIIFYLISLLLKH